MRGAESPLVACVKQMVHVVSFSTPRGVGIGVACLVVVRKYFFVGMLLSATVNTLPRCVGVGQTKIDHASPAISRR